MSKFRLFIDPASISSGWALFRGRDFVASGTVSADKRDPVFERLATLWDQYRAQKFEGARLDEIHLERLPRQTHHYCHWSVGVIGAALQKSGAEILADISPTSWQRHCGWKTKRTDVRTPYRLEPGSPLIPFVKVTDSPDELAAVGLGIYFTEKEAA